MPKSYPIQSQPTDQDRARIQSTSPIRATFSFTSVLVVMVVFGAVASSLAHLWRAAQGDQHEIGMFVVITALSPLAVLVLVSWTFWVFRKLSR